MMPGGREIVKCPANLDVMMPGGREIVKSINGNS